MKFLADMGISQSTVKWLREKGYDAVHLREKGLILSEIVISRSAE
jgi:predicted nuclease of predicted toxin-antitoxin system